MEHFGRLSADNALLSWYPHPALTVRGGYVVRMNRAAEASLAGWQGREVRLLLPDSAAKLECLERGGEQELLEPLEDWPAGNNARYRVAGLCGGGELYLLFAPLEDAGELPSFMLNVDWELRSQLALLLMSARTLRKLCLDGDSLKPEERSKAAAEIDKLQHLAYRFLRMSANIRDVARFLRGEELIVTRWFNFTELCRGVCGDVNGIAEAKAVLFAAPEKPLYLEGDRQLLGRVLYNLLINALIHRDNDATVECELGEGAPEGGTASQTDSVWLRVTGGGRIPDSVIAQMYTAYAKNKEMDEPSGAGLALGLPLCKFIVGAHHGTMLAMNGQNGASVVLSLPVGTRQDGEAPEGGLSGDIDYLGGYPHGLVEMSGLALGSGRYRSEAGRVSGDAKEERA